jgi:hypothetical protein
LPFEESVSKEEEEEEEESNQRFVIHAVYYLGTKAARVALVLLVKGITQPLLT